MTVQDRRKRLNRLLADFDHASRTVKEARRELTAARDRLSECLEARRIVQEAAAGVQADACSRVASVVTRCLRTVGWDYDFKIAFDRKRGKTEARLLFVRDGQELEPQDAAGGGALDVAALALRLACLMLSKPDKRRLIVADEPLKNVNGSTYQDRVGELIETLAEEMGVQFILVSDDPWLQIGHVIPL